MVSLGQQEPTGADELPQPVSSTADKRASIANGGPAVVAGSDQAVHSPGAGGDWMTDDDYRAVVGRRIRVLRVIRQLSQDELAAKSGVTRNYVSAVERAAQGPDLVRVRRLAAALAVPLSGLVDEYADVGIPEVRPVPRQTRRATSESRRPTERPGSSA